jgi:N-acetyltransferase 10
MGYGSRALEQLNQYFEGKLTSLDEADLVRCLYSIRHVYRRFSYSTTRCLFDQAAATDKLADVVDDDDDQSLLTEEIAPRKNLPPLLQQLSERRPESLHYLGTSFGVTLQLFNFWNRAKFTPLYLRQTPVG